MTQIIKAIWDGKVFRPLEAVKFPAHSPVELTVRAPKKRKMGKPYSSLRAIAAMKLQGPSDWSEHFEDYLNGSHGRNL